MKKLILLFYMISVFCMVTTRLSADSLDDLKTAIEQLKQEEKACNEKIEALEKKIQALETQQQAVQPVAAPQPAGTPAEPEQGAQEPALTGGTGSHGYTAGHKFYRNHYGDFGNSLPG